jgi:hypothetical protein
MIPLDSGLATVEKADSVFSAHVIEPALAVGGGLGQLRALVSGYLAYLEGDTFPGGCFFASVLAGVDTQPGAVRDRLVRFLADWLDRLETAVRDAQADGAIDPAEDLVQITFEIEAALLLANAQYTSAGRQNRSSVPAAPWTGASPPRAPRPQPQPATPARLHPASDRAYFDGLPDSLPRRFTGLRERRDRDLLADHLPVLDYHTAGKPFRIVAAGTTISARAAR